MRSLEGSVTHIGINNYARQQRPRTPAFAPPPPPSPPHPLILILNLTLSDPHPHTEQARVQLGMCGCCFGCGGGKRRPRRQAHPEHLAEHFVTEMAAPEEPAAAAAAAAAGGAAPPSVAATPPSPDAALPAPCRHSSPTDDTSGEDSPSRRRLHSSPALGGSLSGRSDEEVTPNPNPTPTQPSPSPSPSPSRSRSPSPQPQP